MKQIITSIDLGSDTIKLVVGEVYNDKVYVLASNFEKSKGIKQGVVINEEEASNALKTLLKKTQDILGIKINKAILTVPSYSAVFIKGEGYTIVEDGVVTGKDITKALQSSVYNRVSTNLELVSVVPKDFILDSEEIVKDPKGKETNKLIVNSILATVPKRNIESAIELLEKNGVKVIDIALGILADYYAYKTKDMTGKTGAVINIGEYKTEVGIVNDDILIASDIIDLGGRNIDKDISYIYDIPLEESKHLKEEFAISYKSKSSALETKEVLTKEEEIIKINQYEVSEIVYSRIREILEATKKSINLLTKGEISYIIITGGTTEIEGFQKVYSEVYGKDRIANELKVLGCRNNKYSSSLGFIKLYSEKLSFREKEAFTVNEEDAESLSSEKRKIDENSLLGKVYGYFFDN